MKKDRKSTQFIAWAAFGVAIGTSIIRLYLLTVQNSYNISSATISFLSYFGYFSSLILLVIWYKKKNYNSTD